jgi:hypothetical protein
MGKDRSRRPGKPDSTSTRYTGAKNNAGEWSVESIARADLVERPAPSRSTDATTAALDAVEPRIHVDAGESFGRSSRSIARKNRRDERTFTGARGQVRSIPHRPRPMKSPTSKRDRPESVAPDSGKLSGKR